MTKDNDTFLNATLQALSLEYGCVCGHCGGDIQCGGGGELEALALVYTEKFDQPSYVSPALHS